MISCAPVFSNIQSYQFLCTSFSNIQSYGLLFFQHTKLWPPVFPTYKAMITSAPDSWGGRGKEKSEPNRWTCRTLCIHWYTHTCTSHWESNQACFQLEISLISQSTMWDYWSKLYCQVHYEIMLLLTSLFFFFLPLLCWLFFLSTGQMYPPPPLPEQKEQTKNQQKSG